MGFSHQNGEPDFSFCKPWVNLAAPQPFVGAFKKAYAKFEGEVFATCGMRSETFSCPGRVRVAGAATGCAVIGAPLLCLYGLRCF
jgi:hypothetical protein